MTSTTTAPDCASSDETTVAPWLPVAAAACTLLMWASAFVVIRHVAHDITPGALGAGRLIVAALIVAPLVWRKGWVPPNGREWALLLACGIGWFGIYNLALNAGERRVDAGTAALIIQVGPIITAVAAVWLFNEVMHRWLVLGLIVGFGGVVLITQGASNAQHGDPIGVLLVVISAFMYAVGVLAQKGLLKRIPAIQVVFCSFVIGAVVCLPFSPDLLDITLHEPALLGWVVYLGVFPTAIAFTTWAFALTHTDAGKLSMTTFLVPVITTAIAWAFLDEVPPTLAFVGGALAITGVLLTRRKPPVRT